MNVWVIGIQKLQCKYYKIIQINSTKVKELHACVWPWIKLIGSSFWCRRRRFTTNLLLLWFMWSAYCIRNMKVRGSTEESEEEKKDTKEFQFVIIIVTHHRTKIQIQIYIFITYLYLGLCFFSVYTRYVWRPTLLVRECVREQSRKSMFNLNTTNPFIVVVNQSLWHHAHRRLCLVFIGVRMHTNNINVRVYSIWDAIRRVSISKMVF